MNEQLLGTVFSAWTVVVCILFAGITWWAFSGVRKADFDAAARLPLEEDADQTEEGMPHG
jgi:cytochrome c oxidase cbb3-type subunit 4